MKHSPIKFNHNACPSTFINFKFIPVSVLKFFKYGMVGGVAAIANISTLMLFKEIFLVHYLLSNCIGFFVGLFVNYFFSKLFVFTRKFKFNRIREFLCYFLISIVGLGFDSILIWIFTEKIRLYYLLSKIISTIIVFWWNFLSRNYINTSLLLSTDIQVSNWGHNEKVRKI